MKRPNRDEIEQELYHQRLEEYVDYLESKANKRELLFGFMRQEYGSSFDSLFYQIESSIDDYLNEL